MSWESEVVLAIELKAILSIPVVWMMLPQFISKCMYMSVEMGTSNLTGISLSGCQQEDFQPDHRRWA